MKYTIQGRLPTLNDYIDACNSSRYAGNNLKQWWENYISAYLRPLQRILKPVEITYKWYEPNRRRDPSNISGGGRKFIEDALVKRGILRGDGWRDMAGFSDEFYIDKDNPRIEIDIKEV